MGFFGKMLKNMKRRRPMMANRIGGFLRNRPQLMERLRNVRGMRGMGRSMMNPNMQFGIMGLNPMMARNIKAKMMGLPNPQDFDANNLPFPEPLKRPDIMPQDPGFGVNLPKPRPIMPGVMPQQYYDQDEYMPKAPIIGMAGGGEANKEDPNPGITALRKVAPEAVEAMGYAPGGPVLGEPRMVDNDADMMNYQRALQNYQKFYYSQPEAFRVNLPHPDVMYNDANGRTISRQDRMIASGLAPAGSGIMALGRTLSDLDSLGRTLSDQDREIIRPILRDQSVTD